MERKELKYLSSNLDDKQLKDKILFLKKGLYVYFNEPNKGSKKLKIHSHFCGNCAWGSGKIPDKKVGLHGVWMGPFTDEDDIKVFLNNNLKEFINKLNKRRCSCIKEYYNEKTATLN